MSETKQIKPYVPNKYIWLIDMGGEVAWCESADPSDDINERDAHKYVLFSDHEKEVKALQQKLSECISALEWYGDYAKNTQSDGRYIHRETPDGVIGDTYDNGSKARETLRGLRDE